MNRSITTRALGATFAASLLFGAAACGDDDAGTSDEEPIENLDGETGDDAEEVGEEMQNQEGDSGSDDSGMNDDEGGDDETGGIETDGEGDDG